MTQFLIGNYPWWQQIRAHPEVHAKVTALYQGDPVPVATVEDLAEALIALLKVCEENSQNP